MGVYLYPSGTETVLKNAYIGEYVENPQDLLSDVIAYYPMAWNLNDTSWNGYNLTTTRWSYTSGANYNTMSDRIWHNASATYNSSASVTINIRLNSNYSEGLVCLWDNSIAPKRWMQIRDGIAYVVVNGNAYNTTTVTTPSWFKMLSAVFDYSARTLKYYINWALQDTKSSIGSWSLRSSSRIIVGNNTYSTNIWITWDLWIIAITQNAMSGADLTKFYNATKWKYGL